MDFTEKNLYEVTNTWINGSLKKYFTSKRIQTSEKHEQSIIGKEGKNEIQAENLTFVNSFLHLLEGNILKEVKT